MNLENNKVELKSRILTNEEHKEYHELLVKAYELQAFIESKTVYKAKVYPSQPDETGSQYFDVELSTDNKFWVCLDGIPAGDLPNSFHLIMEHLITAADLKSYRVNDSGLITEKIIYNNFMDHSYDPSSRNQIYHICRHDTGDSGVMLGEITGIEVDSIDNYRSRFSLKTKIRIAEAFYGV